MKLKMFSLLITVFVLPSTTLGVCHYSIKETGFRYFRDFFDFNRKKRTARKFRNSQEVSPVTSYHETEKYRTELDPTQGQKNAPRDGDYSTIVKKIVDQDERFYPHEFSDPQRPHLIYSFYNYPGEDHSYVDENARPYAEVSLDFSEIDLENLNYQVSEPEVVVPAGQVNSIFHPIYQRDIYSFYEHHTFSYADIPPIQDEQGKVEASFRVLRICPIPEERENPIDQEIVSSQVRRESSEPNRGQNFRNSRNHRRNNWR